MLLAATSKAHGSSASILLVSMLGFELGSGTYSSIFDVAQSRTASADILDPPTGFFTAFEWIRHMMATEKANFFTAHDPDAFKAMIAV